jgi:two-component system response regulator ResD
MTTRSKVLLAEDDLTLGYVIKDNLADAGYDVVLCADGQSALDKFSKESFDICLLDVMMPNKDGFAVAKKIRQQTDIIPILLITAKSLEEDRIHGFESGADDYIVKPFSPREVVLRVKALLRRSSQTTFVQAEPLTKDIIVFPHLTIDNDAHRVLADGQEVSLTPKEYELLFFLAKSPDKVYDREHLLKEVWHYEFFGDLRTVDTHVKRLREKLNKVSEYAAKMIITVWGVGYKFEVINE